MSNALGTKKLVKKNSKRSYSLDGVKDLIARDLEIAHDAKVEGLASDLMMDLEELKNATSGKDITYNVDLSEISNRTETYLEKLIDSE